MEKNVTLSHQIPVIPIAAPVVFAGFGTLEAETWLLRGRLET